MKELKEAKIERFGHKDQYNRISTIFQITYIWRYSFLGIFHYEEIQKLPILFGNEEDAVDFIECGCNVKTIHRELSTGVDVYNFYVYKMDEPDKTYRVIKDDYPLYGYKTLYMIKGYIEEKTWVSTRGAKISKFFEDKQANDEKLAKIEEKNKKDNEYIASLHEVKTYKVLKI